MLLLAQFLAHLLLPYSPYLDVFGTEQSGTDQPGPFAGPEDERRYRQRADVLLQLAAQMFPLARIIDVISDETFEYVTASDQTWGGFNWKLNFRW